MSSVMILLRESSCKWTFENELLPLLAIDALVPDALAEKEKKSEQRAL